MKFVSRAGEKLEHALKTFDISVKDLFCADFGSNRGGSLIVYLLMVQKKFMQLRLVTGFWTGN